MPFRSKAQARYMFATNPKLAAKWEDKTKSIKALPNKVSKRPKAVKKIINRLG